MTLFKTTSITWKELLVQRGRRIEKDYVLGRSAHSLSIFSSLFTSAARVAYCDALGQGRFGTGLEFVGSSEQLEMSVLTTEPKSQQA